MCKACLRSEEFLLHVVVGSGNEEESACTQRPSQRAGHPQRSAVSLIFPIQRGTIEVRARS